MKNTLRKMVVVMAAAASLAGTIQNAFATNWSRCSYKPSHRDWCYRPPKCWNWNWYNCKPSTKTCDFPTNEFCFVSSGLYPGSSYVDLTLSGVPSGYAITNGVYYGWCIDYYSYFGLGYQYCGATFRKSTEPSLPPYLQEIWGSINYILNHKQGTPKDVQNAIWYFSDGVVPPLGEQTPAYFAMVNEASSQGSYVPGPGEVFAVILDLVADPATQNLIIEFICPPPNPGCGTPGYWKNHPLSWKITHITLGGCKYSILQAIKIMQCPTKGDKTYNLAEHLIAAKLNVLAGNDSSCISDEIANADSFLALFPIGSGVSAYSTAWKTLGAELLETLADYNEGKLCAPSRD